MYDGTGPEGKTTPFGLSASRGNPRRRSLSVVIPAYNEQEILRDTVSHVVEGVRALGLERWELLICQNGSRDETAAIADDLAREIDEVKVVTLSRADYGAAMRAGFLSASGDAIVNFDADYYNLDFLADALRTDADIVVAAKAILGSEDARVVTRRVVSRCFGWLVRRLLCVRVTETHGMKLFRREAIAGMLPHVVSTKDLFDTELLARAEWAGLSIVELPVTTRELRHSRSGIVRRIPRTMWSLLALRFRLGRLRRARVAAPVPLSSQENRVDVAV